MSEGYVSPRFILKATSFMSKSTTIIALFLLLPSCYYVYLLASFYSARIRASGIPPKVPHFLPFIAHTRTFALGGKALRDALAKHANPTQPIRFCGLGFSFALLSGKDLICKSLATSTAQHLDWNKLSAPYFGSTFGASECFTRAASLDDSGVGVKPYPGTNVPSNHRLLRGRLLFFHDALSKKGVDELVPRFTENLRRNCKRMAQGDKWVEMSSLHSVVRDIIFPAIVDAVFGPNLLADSPELLTMFWEFDDCTPFLGRMMPNFLKPNAAKSRDACLLAMKRWRRRAEEESAHAKADGSAEWDPIWGIGAIKRRQRDYDAADGLFDEQAKVSMDLETLWAFAANMVPATTWLLFHIISCPQVFQSIRSEISASHEDFSSLAFNTDLLTSQPLFQSMWAESLRLHAFSLITRNAKSTISLGPWTIPKDQQLMVSTQVEHYHSDWDTDMYSASTFWPERFLVKDEQDQKTKFSLEGKHGKWMPFSIGEHMCPGRHLAKKEMFATIAVLLDMFDLELSCPKGWVPEDSLRRYGYGAARPKQDVKFRMRKRQI
ncbi:cytochrome P450 [Amniculicola lignicola CBS 123094]|uniref:Cytochrome P450 n=1 Tax=Amniculicola lignicola CBS 123094 TaxID=1392246 RepID=A0A6A5VZG9_9PLEO|nr:cytochrome P450 [Amniculicola lignicola CBS 123094]